jgi:hypothetical protein
MLQLSAKGLYDIGFTEVVDQLHRQQFWARCVSLTKLLLCLNRHVYWQNGTFAV